ncbi:hypothetical protein HHL11_20845 [Ramlibacter sp. G-1-2-2]|uniref:Uncharacterized protein n=1 Tax=Ramlibacter agri TaxID=2728837 RepID=A0A848H9M5_9BURK|nr:hypothetical protein [Ramlibacter agri]NML46209.1 hypothetical protein [Ramlibacter agri]
MILTLCQIAATVIARWLSTWRHSRRVRVQPVPPEPLDEEDVAQRVRLSGEW